MAFMYKRQTKLLNLKGLSSTFSLKPHNILFYINGRKILLVETGLNLSLFRKNIQRMTLATRENKNKHGDQQCNGEYQSL